MDLSGIGIWSSQLGYGDPGEIAESAAELEELGYQALWIPDVGGPVIEGVTRLLESTGRIVVATGILNLWMHEPGDVAASHAALTAEHGERFLLGIGVSHAPLIDALRPGKFGKPLSAMREFLEALDAAEQPVALDQRVIAALGPKMLNLAATRTLGAHPYLVTTEHTRQAREILGDGPLLLPEQAVILTDSAEQARAIGVPWLHAYLAMPNYANSLLRLGFSDDEVATVSDRLFDALIAWGDEDAILSRVAEHQSAGADHVCLQVLTDDLAAFPREEWRRIAQAIT